MPNLPITSVGSAVPLLQQQLADVAAALDANIVLQQTVIAAGSGPTYTIAGRVGSETVGMLEFLKFLGEQSKEYLEMQKLLLEQLQAIQPFALRQRIRVRGILNWGRGGRWWGGW